MSRGFCLSFSISFVVQTYPREDVIHITIRDIEKQIGKVHHCSLLFHQDEGQFVRQSAVERMLARSSR